MYPRRAGSCDCNVSPWTALWKRKRGLVGVSDCRPISCAIRFAAVEVLMQNVYRLGLAERLGYKHHVFRVCAAVARYVPVFRFSRPKDFIVLEDTVEFLEDHLRDRL